MAMKLNAKEKALIEENASLEGKEKVLEVKDLVISFKTDNGLVQAVRGVSFDLYKQETLCIVGESGSGKSVTSKTIMGILSKNALIQGGQILYEGEDLLKISEEEFHRIRGHKIGMIFQDPLSSLNPIVKIGKQLTETMMINKDQLKRRYNDLIAPELTAYKNAQVEKESLARIKESQLDVLLFERDNAAQSLKKQILEAKDEIVFLRKIAKKANAKDELIEAIEKAKKEKNTAESALNSLKAENPTGKKRANFAYYERQIIKEDEKIMRIEEKVALINRFIDKNKGSLEEQIAALENSILQKNNELKSLSSRYKESVALKKKEIKEARKEGTKLYKEKVPALEAALKAKKKEVKKNNHAYKKEAKKERDLALSKLKEKRNSYSLNNKDKLELVNVNRQIRKIKFLYALLTTLCYFLPKKRRKLFAKEEEELIPLIKRRDELAKELDAFALEELTIKEEYQKKTRLTKKIAKKRALEVMKEVGIPQPEKRFNQYPFQFSGGMRQRIVIAIALVATPDILICDEPTTALDVTIQAQILELINHLKETRHMSVIFITHDLGVVANMADRVAVMYAGKIVEYGTEREVFFDPRHPYTWALLSSIPDIDSEEKLEAIPGTPPDMIYPPSGDAFAARNKYALGIDYKAEPPFFKISKTHFAATWLEYPGAPKVEPPAIVKTRILNALKEEENRRHE